MTKSVFPKLLFSLLCFLMLDQAKAQCVPGMICAMIDEIISPKGALKDIFEMANGLGVSKGIMKGANVVTKETLENPIEKGGKYYASVEPLGGSGGVQVASVGSSAVGFDNYSQVRRAGSSTAILLDSQDKEIMDGAVNGCNSFRNAGNGRIDCITNRGDQPLTIKGIQESNGFVTTHDLASKKTWSSSEIADAVDFDLCSPALNKIESKQLKKEKLSLSESPLAWAREKGSLNSNATTIQVGEQKIEIEAVQNGPFKTCTVKAKGQKFEGCYAIFLNSNGKTLECRTQQGQPKIDFETTQEERAEVLESAYSRYFKSGKNMSGQDLVKLWRDERKFRPNIEDIYNRSKGSATASGGSAGSSKSGAR